MSIKIGFAVLSHNEPEQVLRLVRGLNAMFGAPPIVCHHDFGKCSLDETVFPSNVRFVHPHFVTRWGHIDFLINNAGVGNPKPLDETDDETLDYFLNLMLRAPFRLARDVLPHMSPGSAIINVTSTFAVVGGLRGGAYSAAKGGLTALTTHIACQYGSQGIRCNAVAPGVTQTPMVERRLQDKRFLKMNTEMTPHQRLATVDDIASTIAFLCSEGGSFINGQTIVVDGGWSSTKYLSDFALTSEWVAR